MTGKDIQKRLRSLAEPAQAKILQRFFKTGPGEYGEGDEFLGIKVPILRKTAREFKDLSLDETRRLLTSPVHEERFLALVILVQKFKKGDPKIRETIFSLYCSHTQYINNWDLVDTSAEHIIGGHLLDRDRSLLYDWAGSDSLWERRIAIMSTFHFIRQQHYTDTLKLAAILLNDPEDLIHKAVGWMLREIGNRDRDIEETFLKSHYQTMPRTMLRYAIEKFPEDVRQGYLKGTI